MLFVDQIRTLFLIESQEYFWKWERKEEEFDPSLNITRKSCLLLRHCCSLRFTTASRLTVHRTIALYTTSLEIVKTSL